MRFIFAFRTLLVPGQREREQWKEEECGEQPRDGHRNDEKNSDLQRETKDRKRRERDEMREKRERRERESLRERV